MHVHAQLFTISATMDRDADEYTRAMAALAKKHAEEDAAIAKTRAEQDAEIDKAVRAHKKEILASIANAQR